MSSISKLQVLLSNSAGEAGTLNISISCLLLECGKFLSNIKEPTQKIQIGSEGQTDEWQLVGKEHKRMLLYKILSTVSSSSFRDIQKLYCTGPL